MPCKLPKHSGTFVAALLLASLAVAQQQSSPDGATYTPGTFNQPYYGGGGNGGGYGGGYGWGWGGGGGAGSTAAGSYMTGMGNAIRAQGQYNLDTSAAAINVEEAAKRDIENQKLWTQTYFEKRRINQAYKDSQKRPRSPDSWVRIAQEAAPNRLSPSALDPVTGQIAWPPGLQGPEFQSDRQKLDRLFADRAMVSGAIGVDVHGQIRAAVNAMIATLKSRIRDYETSQYLNSRNFLTSLAYEATLPTTGYTATASR